MCISDDFGLISVQNKILNFFGVVNWVLVWKKNRIYKIYLLDFDTELSTGNE